MIEALLVANRGEIAVRACRAANELGVRSIAVYVPEDRDSVHRLKADESYGIGVAGHPVSTYLDAQLVVDLAVTVGADAIYPGYGFMAENPVLARCCEAAGVCFVGPPAGVLGLAGDKTRAREVARAAGVGEQFALGSRGHWGTPLEHGNDIRPIPIGQKCISTGHSNAPGTARHRDQARLRRSSSKRNSTPPYQDRP
jgi:pyruvate carboxylase